MIARLNGHYFDSSRVEHVSEIHVSAYDVWINLRLRKRPEAIQVFFTTSVKNSLFNVLVVKDVLKEDEKRFVNDYKQMSNPPMPSNSILIEYKVFDKINSLVEDFLRVGNSLQGRKNEFEL